MPFVSLPEQEADNDAAALLLRPLTLPLQLRRRLEERREDSISIKKSRVFLFPSSKKKKLEFFSTSRKKKNCRREPCRSPLLPRPGLATRRSRSPQRHRRTRLHRDISSPGDHATQASALRGGRQGEEGEEVPLRRWLLLLASPSLFLPLPLRCVPCLLPRRPPRSG